MYSVFAAEFMSWSIACMAKLNVMNSTIGFKPFSAAPTAMAVTGRVQGLEVADLTIRAFAGHAISFAKGPQAPRLTNLRLTDTGHALVAVAAGVNDGIIEHASFDYTTTGVSAAAAGIDLQGVRGWTVRLNAFRNVRGPAGVTAGLALAPNTLGYLVISAVFVGAAAPASQRNFRPTDSMSTCELTSPI